MKKITLLAILLLVTVLACKKDPLGVTKNNSKEHDLNMNTAMTPDVMNLDYPEVKMDILKFRNAEHYDRFYNQLEALELTTEEEDATNSTDEVLTFDDKLNAIEHYLGFTSIRKAFYVAFEVQNVEGWSSMDQVPVQELPLGDISLTLMNEDKNVIIGNTLYNYFSEDVVVKLTDPSLEAISQIRNANGNLGTLFSLNLARCEIIQDLQGCKITSSTPLYKTLGDTTWHSQPLIDYTIPRLRKTTVGTPVNCATPNFGYELSSYILGFTTGSTVFDWRAFSYFDYYIDWGDGTIHTGSTNGSANSYLDNHTYTTSGQYNVVAKYRPAGYGYYPMSNSFVVDVPNYSCSNKPQGSNRIPGSKESPDGSRCVRGELKCYKRWVPIFTNTNRSRIKAKSWGFKKKRGKWKKRKMNTIKVKYDVDVLLAHNCSVLYPLNPFDSKNNRKKIVVDEPIGLGNVPSTTPNYVNLTYGDLGFEEIISVHEIDDGGSSKSAKLTLTLRACDY